MLAGSGTTHTVYLVRPSKYADAGAPPPPKITCTSEARAALQRLAQLYEFSVVDSLPTDLMLHILLELWQSWPLATRALRVSKGLAECATMARGLLPPREWWTGSGPPLQVPGSAIDEKIGRTRARSVGVNGVGWNGPGGAARGRGAERGRACKAAGAARGRRQVGADAHRVPRAVRQRDGGGGGRGGGRCRME